MSDLGPLSPELAVGKGHDDHQSGGYSERSAGSSSRSEPWLEVIGDHRKVKAGRLRVLNVAYELVGRSLLAHHRVAEGSHGAGATRRMPRQTDR